MLRPMECLFNLKNRPVGTPEISMGVLNTPPPPPATSIGSQEPATNRVEG